MIDLFLQLACVALVLAVISLFICTLPIWARGTFLVLARVRWLARQMAEGVAHQPAPLVVVLTR